MPHKLSLAGKLTLGVTTFPRDERRFSVHMWLSDTLGPVAMTRDSGNDTVAEMHMRRHPCTHHTAPQVHVIHLPPADSSSGGNEHRTTGALNVTLSLENLAWTINTTVATALLSASLNVDVYNHVLNEHEEDTMNQCGSAVLPLLAIAWRSNAETVVRTPLVVPGERSNGLQRGTLIYPPMVGGSPRVSVDGSGWVVDMESGLFEQKLTAIMQPEPQHIVSPVRRWAAVFAQLKPRYSCMRGINAYTYDARKCRVPMYGYVCRPAPNDGAEMFEHLLQLVLRRVGVTQEQFLRASLTNHAPHGLRSPHGCVPTPKTIADHNADRRTTMPERVLTEVLGAAVHYMPYLLDQVGDGADKRTGEMHRRNIESFDFARALLKLDCEDGAEEAVLEFMSLVALRNAGALSPALRKLIQVARMYVPFMWLVAVSSIEINEDHMDKVSDLPAHMHAALVPIAMWHHWTAHIPSLPLPPWCDDKAVRNSADAPGVLLIEGTGFLDGTGDDPTLDERTLFYKIVASRAGEAWRNARKEYGFNRGAPSNFYKLLVMSYSPAWADQGLCGFVPMLDGDTRHFGIRFQDINALQCDADRWKNIRFMPLPALTADERAVVAAVAADDYPIAPLPRPTDNAPHFYRHAEPVADALRAKLATLVAKSSQAPQRPPPGATTVPVRWFLSYPNMTRMTADALVDAVDFCATGQSIGFTDPEHNDGRQRHVVAWLRSARVDREDIMDALGGYHIELTILMIQ